MHYGSYILIGAILVALVGVTGWWRFAFALFRIRSSAMTVRRLGLSVSPEPLARRVDTLLECFAGGFNAMIARPSSRAWQAYCDALPALYRPFAHEGAAMGFTLRRLFRYNAAAFESQMVQPRGEFRYLYYVGLGFWSGMRGHGAGRLTRIVEGLDPLHRYLCYDGYGFKHAFFDHAKGANGLSPLDRLEGYARNAAYQGVGRAFWFSHMGHGDVLREQLSRLGTHAADGVAGVGLAAVFVSPDRLEVARELAVTLPREWHSHCHLGMCFGLKARSLCDPDQFRRDMGQAEAGVRRAVEASIETCDRFEAQIRSEGAADGYRRWRALVAEWMDAHIEYPLAGVKRTIEKAPKREAVAT